MRNARLINYLLSIVLMLAIEILNAINGNTMGIGFIAYCLSMIGFDLLNINFELKKSNLSKRRFM